MALILAAALGIILVVAAAAVAPFGGLWLALLVAGVSLVVGAYLIAENR